MITRITPSLLAPPGNNPPRPFSRRYPPRVPDYQTSYPLMVHDPYAAPYGQSLPVISLTKLLRNTCYPLIISIRLTCSLHTATTASLSAPTAAAAACCLRAWPALLLPTSTSLPPSLSNQTPATSFQPYEDPDRDLGDVADLTLLPSCESPSEYPSWSNLATRPTEVEDGST